jgi:hypothetical protein
MKKANIPEKFEIRIHCKCCRVSLAKSKMPTTMEGLLSWHARWENAMTQYDACGHVILDQSLFYSAGYPLPQMEVLQDLWKHEHRKLVGYRRRRRMVTEHKMVIHPRLFGGGMVNLVESLTIRRRKVVLAPVFTRFGRRGERIVMSQPSRIPTFAAIRKALQSVR